MEEVRGGGGHNARQVPISQIKSLIAPRARLVPNPMVRLSGALLALLTRHHCQILISRNWPREGRKEMGKKGGRDEVWTGEKGVRVREI